MAARRYQDVAHQRRPVHRSKCKRKRRDRIERLEYIALASHYGPAKRGIEEMFLYQPPRQQFSRLIVAVIFDKKSLRYPVLELICIRQRRIGIEANKIREIIYAGNVAIGNYRLDGMLVSPF